MRSEARPLGGLFGLQEGFQQPTGRPTRSCAPTLGSKIASELEHRPNAAAEKEKMTKFMQHTVCIYMQMQGGGQRPAQRGARWLRGA
jgi:hypothetical protein